MKHNKSLIIVRSQNVNDDDTMILLSENQHTCKSIDVIKVIFIKCVKMIVTQCMTVHNIMRNLLKTHEHLL